VAATIACLRCGARSGLFADGLAGSHCRRGPPRPAGSMIGTGGRSARNQLGGGLLSARIAVRSRIRCSGGSRGSSAAANSVGAACEAAGSAACDVAPSLQLQSSTERPAGLATLSSPPGSAAICAWPDLLRAATAPYSEALKALAASNL